MKCWSDSIIGGTVKFKIIAITCYERETTSLTKEFVNMKITTNRRATNANA